MTSQTQCGVVGDTELELNPVYSVLATSGWQMEPILTRTDYCAQYRCYR